MKQQTQHKIRPVNELLAYENNARQHSDAQVDEIANSIKAFGFINPVLTHGDTIMAGHGRIMAAKQLGMTEVPTVDASYLTDEQKRAYILADNRLAEKATWDDVILREELAALEDEHIDLTGFADCDLVCDDEGELSCDDEDSEADEADDTIPDEVPPRVKLGDLIELGKHRVLCGDCTDRANVDRLMGGEKADMVFTDPPYSSGGFQEAGKAVGSVGTRQNIKIANDNLSTRGYKTLINQMLSVVMAETLLMFGDWRMWIENFDLAEKNGFRVRNMIVWNKNSMGMGRPFRNQHELILFGSRENVKYEISSVANVLSFNRCKNELHPTQKPIELLETVLSNFDINISQTIVEPFLGSGSTLIACEKTQRKCYGIELDPTYCDTIIQRYIDFTGDNNVKINGELVNW